MTDHSLRFDGPEEAPLTLVLAHGAGAGMDTPFMERIATGVASYSYRVARFEFPYMLRRRDTGKRSPPDRAPVLEACWLEVLEQLGPADRLVIGGKSMGGRIASRIADQAGVAGLVCLGYPFHPPGRPETLRTAHLLELKTPALFVQGVRDVFGNQEEVPGYGLSPAIEIEWMADGDHSLKPRKASGRSHEDNLAAAVEAIVTFLRQRQPT